MIVVLTEKKLTNSFCTILRSRSSIKAAKPKLKEFNRFAKVELYPPTPVEIPAIIRGFSDLIRAGTQGRWANVTVKEAMVNTCITIEVLCWFFVGECIGKRNIIGYDV